MPSAPERAIEIERLDRGAVPELATSLVNLPVVQSGGARSCFPAASPGALPRDHVPDAAFERRVEMENIE